MSENLSNIHDPNLRGVKVRAKIEGFFDYVEGTFHLHDVYDALGAKTTDEKAAIRRGLSREKKAGTIETTTKYGVWRKVDKFIEWCDLSACPGSSAGKMDAVPVSYTHLTLPTTPYV